MVNDRYDSLRPPQGTAERLNGPEVVRGRKFNLGGSCRRGPGKTRSLSVDERTVSADKDCSGKLVSKILSRTQQIASPSMRRKRVRRCKDFDQNGPPRLEASKLYYISTRNTSLRISEILLTHAGASLRQSLPSVSAHFESEIRTLRSFQVQR